MDIRKTWGAVLVFAPLESGGSTLIPVPLHGRRERERGYNQAQIICDVLSSRYGTAQSVGSLLRIRHTAQQAKLGRAGRLNNMKNAFEWRGGVVPEHVVLVDDVYTTGATMQECARVLKAAGAKRVEGYVIARG